MAQGNVENYISNLPIGALQAAMQPEEDLVKAVDINKLPQGIVTGSNLIQFPKDASPQVKSSVALSLLAAQRVASNDPVLLTPKQWIERHNTVLQNLNWQDQGGGEVDAEFKNFNVAVHEAIIPFLTAAFGGAAAASLIVTALNQLKKMDENSPWITLFDRESRRFSVTEYQFSVVEVQGDQVRLKLVSARFDVSFGKTQVLFFKVKKEKARFISANKDLTASADLLTEMNDGLKAKLAGFTQAYIRDLPL